jgi:hypothetical protein
MHGETKNEFSLTRAALTTGGRPKSDFTPEKRTKKKTLVSELRMHIRRLLVVMFITICGNLIFYIIAGVVNRLLLKPIKTIFLFYSVNIEYRRTMIPDWYADVVRWRPGFSQVIRHRHWAGGMSFGITSSDDDFRDEKNRERLVKLHKDVDRIRRIVGAEQMTFSGILPGILVANGIVKREDCIENKNTAKVIIKAESKTTKLAKIPSDCPVIILGGKGFTGKEVTKILEGVKRRIYLVDVKDSAAELPPELRGMPVIVLNITKTGALAEYIPQLWREAVVLNEVYPEPTKQEQDLMRARGISCYHVTGVKASAWPRFLKAYKGGIPCCAAYLPDDNCDALVTKLV